MELVFEHEIDCLAQGKRFITCTRLKKDTDSFLRQLLDVKELLSHLSSAVKY